MNKYGISIFAAIFVALILSVQIGLKYSQAAIVFGSIAALLAPMAIHRVRDRSAAVGLLVVLAIFASHPIKKLFQIDGYVLNVSLTLAYCGTLWIVGMGWKRSSK